MNLRVAPPSCAGVRLGDAAAGDLLAVLDAGDMRPLIVLAVGDFEACAVNAIDATRVTLPSDTIGHPWRITAAEVDYCPTCTSPVDALAEPVQTPPAVEETGHTPVAAPVCPPRESAPSTALDAAPYGYRTTDSDALEEHAGEQAVIAAVSELHDAGLTEEEIADELAEAGFEPAPARTPVSRRRKKLTAEGRVLQELLNDESGELTLTADEWAMYLGRTYAQGIHGVLTARCRELGATVEVVEPKVYKVTR